MNDCVGQAGNAEMRIKPNHGCVSGRQCGKPMMDLRYFVGTKALTWLMGIPGMGVAAMDTDGECLHIQRDHA